MQRPHSTAAHDHLAWTFPYSMFISAQQLRKKLETVSQLLFLIWFICVSSHNYNMNSKYSDCLLCRYIPKTSTSNMTCGRMNKTLSYPPAGPLLWGQNKISWKKFGKRQIVQCLQQAVEPANGRTWSGMTEFTAKKDP